MTNAVQSSETVGPVSTYEMVRIKLPCYYEREGKEERTGLVPKRLGLMRRDAAMALPPWYFGTDFYRSATQQITALRDRKGAQWPGYSGHGEGVSTDGAISYMLKTLGIKKKKDLDAKMLKYGWVNHLLTPDAQGHEEWHYNYLPEIASILRHNPKACGSRSLDELEAYIRSVHNDEWNRLSTFDVTKSYRGEDAKPLQWHLAKAGFYEGEIDGIWGRYSQSAFQHAVAMWGRKNHSTKRVLAFICAKIEVIGEVHDDGGTRVLTTYAEKETLNG